MEGRQTFCFTFKKIIAITVDRKNLIFSLAKSTTLDFFKYFGKNEIVFSIVRMDDCIFHLRNSHRFYQVSIVNERMHSKDYS